MPRLTRCGGGAKHRLRRHYVGERTLRRLPLKSYVADFFSRHIGVVAHCCFNPEIAALLREVAAMTAPATGSGRCPGGSPGLNGPNNPSNHEFRLHAYGRRRRRGGGPDFVGQSVCCPERRSQSGKPATANRTGGDEEDR